MPRCAARCWRWRAGRTTRSSTGCRCTRFRLPHTAIVEGDGTSLSIAAASVIAKVTRDRHHGRRWTGSTRRMGLHGTKAMRRAAILLFSRGMALARSIVTRFGPWVSRCSRFWQRSGLPQRLRRWLPPLTVFRREGLSTDPRHVLGRQGEKMACRFLRRRGYKVLYRNFRAPRRRRGGHHVPSRRDAGFRRGENACERATTAVRRMR